LLIETLADNKFGGHLMPRSQKQKTSVKREKKPRLQKKKPTRRKKRTNKPLLELASGRAASNTATSLANPFGTEEDILRMEDFTDVSEERTSIISIVKGLEGQVETAFELKKVLEAELDATQKKLFEESDARVQLEIQVTSLEAETALAKQLREDLSFAEEERNKFANLLAQTQEQLEEVTAERDSLAEQMASTEVHARELEDGKRALEAQVMNLKDRVTDTNRLRGELMEITEAHQDSREQVHDLTRRLEASEASKEALETELAGAHQNTRTLREEGEELQKKVAATDNRTADLRIQFEDQQAINRELMETTTRLENEVKMVNINYDAAKNELNAFKNALRDIRSEATRTSGRVRQKYLKPKKKTNSSQKRLQSSSTKA
jgi:chromosome segregation ATPase